MGNPVTHFEVIGKDGEKLQQFYSQVFSWKINADNPMKYGMVSGETNESSHGIGGGIGAGPNGEDYGVTFYIEVPNLEQTLQKIEQAGGQTTMAPDDVPGGPRMAQFTDPEGHRIGLVQAGSMQAANQN